MQNFLYDLRYAIRQLRNTPGMALLAILTLALGVGANTAIFTVIDSVLLRPLPYAHSDRLVFIGPGGDKPSFGSTSWLNYADVHAQSKLLEDSVGYAEDVSVLETKDTSVSVVAPRVTPNLFAMLGQQPLLGRTFTEAEGQTDGPSVVMLSEGLWRDTFHADPNIVGQVVKVGGKTTTVVGVMPSTFSFPESMGADLKKGVWLPIQPTQEMLTQRGYHFFNVAGVMRPGVTVAQLQQEVNAIAARIPHEHNDTAITFRVDPYQEVLTGPVRPVLFALLGALGAGAADRVRECFESADCAGAGAAAGVCGARGAGRRTIAADRADAVGGIVAERAGMRRGCCAGRVGDGGNTQAAGWHDPARRFDRDSLDGAAGAGGDCGADDGAFVAAAGVAGGASESAERIAGGFARSRIEVGGRQTGRMAGGGRGGIVDAAAGGDGAAVPDAMEPGAINLGIRDGAHHHVFGDAGGCGGVFRNGGVRRIRRMRRHRWR